VLHVCSRVWVGFSYSNVLVGLEGWVQPDIVFDWRVTESEV
jgi:hypothetical protein